MDARTHGVWTYRGQAAGLEELGSLRAEGAGGWFVEMVHGGGRRKRASRQATEDEEKEPETISFKDPPPVTHSLQLGLTSQSF